MVNRKGTSTKNAYMNNAGRVNNQPTKFSRRIRLLRWVRREATKAAERLSEVTININVDQAGAGIVLRPSHQHILLRDFSFVFFLNSLEQASRVLLTADHLLEFGCPALSKDRARGIGDEVHRAA